MNADKFIMPFGKYKGMTLDAIATDDDGLRYLDWLRGEREATSPDSDVAQALAKYLDDPLISDELERIYTKRGGR